MLKKIVQIIAASYARFSSDKQKATSTADQHRNNDQLAKRDGTSIHRYYADDAITGTRAQRPDYQRMLEDARKRLFNVLYVEDLSRLGRDMPEREMAIRTLEFNDVRIITADGYDSENPEALKKMFRGARNITDDVYLTDLAERTMRGQKARIAEGLSAGGKTYGYRSSRIYDESRKDAYGDPVVTGVRKVVDSEQARVVQKIFKWYVDGWSPQDIANELNRLGIPSPRGKTWSRSTIYADRRSGIGVLGNPLYTGKVVWNRSTNVKNPENDNRPQRRENAEDEWITHEIPELQIIDDKLWNAAQKRVESTRNHTISQALKGKSSGGRRQPKFLFSGLLKCGVCGSNMTMANGVKYQCQTSKDGGPDACSNGILVRRDIVEQRLLESIKKELLSESAVRFYQSEMKRMVAEVKRQTPISDTEAPLKEQKTKVQNLVDAIEMGGPTTALLTALTTAQELLETIEARHKAQNTPIKVPDVTTHAKQYREMVRSFEKQELEASAVQPALKALLGETITVTPGADGVLIAEISGDAIYGGILPLTADSLQPSGVGSVGSGGRI